MPKANKHAEVKPSKYKTSLCANFMKTGECAFGARCAFAHGEADLKQEEANKELLKTTGLQRLEPLYAVEVESPASEGLTPTPRSPVALRPRRRLVMVSLPKQTTSFDAYQSPYEQAPHVYEQAQGGRTGTVAALPVKTGTHHCECRFSATCRTGQPTVYRHNPYGFTGPISQPCS